MNPPSWLPKTAAHVTQRGFSEEPSLQRLLFAFPLSAAASHLDACQKRKEKKQPSLLLLNNLSIKTKPEQQPRAGRLFCLMLNIPRLGQQAPECQELVRGPGVGSVVGAGLVRKGPAQPPALRPAWLVGQNQHCSSVHSHFAELSCSPRVAIPSQHQCPNKAKQTKLNPSLAPAIPSDPGTDPATGHHAHASTNRTSFPTLLQLF